MRKQINIALILGFLLIGWLFTHSIIKYKARKLEVNNEFLFKDKKMEIKREKLEQRKNAKRYEVINSKIRSAPLIILYDKKTGEAWRYYRSITDKGKIEDEGWVSLTYTFPYSDSPKGLTPKITLENKIEKIRKELKKQKKSENKNIKKKKIIIPNKKDLN